MVNSPSFKRAVAIANEVTRPSFWSILAHTNKYQKTKAKARIHNDEIPGGRESASATSADRKKGTAVKKRIWSGLSGKRIPKLQRAGHRESTDEKKAKGKKSNTSLFRKLVSQLERRNGKKTSPSAAAASAAAATTSTATARESQDRSKESTKAFRRSLDAAIGNDSLKFHGRSKSLWKPARNADYEHPGRRVMSSLTGSANRKTRDLENVNAGDDQYVTFITSVA